MNEAFETIYLLAALQGLLLSLFLFTKKENHAANLILAVATIALSIELASVAYYTRGWYKILPHAMGFSYPFPFLYGPLFFLYAKLISKKAERLRASDLLHLIPMLAVYGITAPIFFYSGEEKIMFLDSMKQNVHSPVFSVIDGIRPIQGIIYTVLTIRIVADYNRNIKESFSTIDLINLNWLRHLTLGLIIIWSIVAFLWISTVIMPGLPHIDALLNIPLAILIYIIGYMGLKQPEIFLDPSASSSQAQNAAKYQRSGLSDENAEEIKRKLLALMASEKPFLRQDLTLQKLAERLKTSSHNLSEVINRKLNQSYYDFVNQYRVGEFKSRLADPDSGRYNLLSIALDSGFQSKGTFNSIFKKLTGMTPSQYKATLTANS